MYLSTQQEQVANALNSQLFFDNVLNSFKYNAICKYCNQEIPLIEINHLIIHQIDCQQNVHCFIQDNQRSEQIQPLTIEKSISLQIQSAINCDEKKKEKIIQQLLDFGKLSKGSQNLYRPALIKLLKNFNDHNLLNLNSQQLRNIVKYQCKSTNQVNAINRIRKSLHLCDSIELLSSIKQQKKILKEGILKRPHRSWDLRLIQEFLDELIKYERAIMAFRIYILYELAARISELNQITFKMVIEGIIIYTPQKQKRLGNLAERKFKIGEQIINITKEFQTLYQILADSTLNIGYDKQLIRSQSFHKQLHFALNLIKQQSRSQENDFIQFLEQFQYHDLRYTKITEMHKCGINEKLIQSFVKHQSIKTSQQYIKLGNHQDILDLNDVNIGEVPKSNYKPQILKINFNKR